MSDYNHLYVPMSELINEEVNLWTFVELNTSYKQMCDMNVILWCDINVRGKWTQILSSKFGFELEEDAVLFTIQFIQ